MQTITIPGGQPLTGRWVRLDLLGEADLDEMYPLLSDPAVYEPGYVMHRRPPEANLLQLAYCFDDCGYGRVKIQTGRLAARLDRPPS